MRVSKNFLNTYANRGMDLENDINISNEHYRNIDKALIYKKPTPIKISKVNYPAKNKAIISEAFFEIPSTTDYNGIYKGKYIDFDAKEVLLFGKGNKHRTSYLNAKAEVALRDYLNERTDNNTALFVHDRKPYSRFKKSGIELMVRKIMKRTSDVSTHVTPHVFRHTTASVALNRGMNIVDVSKLLGHNRVETTMEYITTSSNSVKNNHRNCII